MEQHIQALTARIAALEAVGAVSRPIDYSDPPLYLVDEVGAPVDPESIEKIPDLVRDLPSFSGDPTELNAWLKDAEGLVNWYSPNQNSNIARRNKFHVICKTIRRKIRGEANDALVTSNVNINWHLIKKTLTTYYGEKRDLGTLDYQLSNSCQRGRTLEDFYTEINKILSLISNCVATDDQFSHPEAAKSVLQLYTRKAIDAFVRGLDGEVGKFLKNANVDSLATAYAYCITFQNMEFRKHLTKPKIIENFPGPRNQIPLPPKIPPKVMQTPRFPFKPVHIPQHVPKYAPFGHQYFPPPIPQRRFTPFNNSPFNNANLPQRNPFSKPVDKPVPMDIDPSIRSRQINYQNRPTGPPHGQPMKRPRLYNVETQNYEDPQQDLEITEQIDYYPTDDEEYYPEETSTYERYIRQIEAQDRERPAELEEQAELNFLE